jgi:hypothetical protein
MRADAEMWTPPPRQRRPHPIARRIILISVALLIVLLTALIIVYQRAAAELDAHVKAESSVTHYVAMFFSPEAVSTMSYDDIIALMSTYGMMLDNSACAPYDAYEPQAESQEKYLSGPDHFLAFDTTVLTPPDWEAQLRALPNVIRVETQLICDGDGIDALERSWPGWWHGVTNPFFSPLRDPSPIRLRASDATLNYEHAVRLALEMGFRLADPSFEAAKKGGQPPPWRPVSQADLFTAQRMLLVAPTIGTPRDWKSQIEATHEFSILS